MKNETGPVEKVVLSRAKKVQCGGPRKSGQVHLLNVEKGPAIRLTAQGNTRLRVLAQKGSLSLPIPFKMGVPRQSALLPRFDLVRNLDLNVPSSLRTASLEKGLKTLDRKLEVA